MTKLKEQTKKYTRDLCKSVIRTLLPEQFVCKKNCESFMKQRKLPERMSNGNFLDLLTTVHIETRTRCNSLCTYCGANARFDQREDMYMSEETYHKIIDSLAEIDYSRRVSPYCNNEPLLDEHIYPYIAYTRKKLPEATIELKTNGTVLDEEKLKQLFDNGLSILYINDKLSSSHISEKINELQDKYKEVYNEKMFVSRKSYSDQTAKLNRAGSNPFKSALARPKNYFCYRPFEMAVFTVDGSMCCCSNDFYLENNIGNIHKASLKELFSNERIQTLRKCLMEHDRSEFDACKKCDYLGISAGHDYSCPLKFLLPIYL